MDYATMIDKAIANLKLLKAGKKMTYHQWEDDDWIKFDKQGEIFMDKDLDEYELEDCRIQQLSEMVEFDITKVNFNFETALEKLNDGATLSRAAWKTATICFKKDRTNAKLTVEDMQAKDWYDLGI